MDTISFLKRVLRGCWYFFWGNIFTFLFYDRKYLTGKWFAGKLFGLCSTGWEWTTHDGFSRLLLQKNVDTPFPVSSQIKITGASNIHFHPDDLNNFQTVGSYFQGIGEITIGHGTYIASNVGLITANHDPHNLDNHLPPKSIVLGEHCWIGMNTIILPGVELGDNTVVGAGSVVTKSFPEGRCVIAGNPARLIRRISDEEK